MIDADGGIVVVGGDKLDVAFFLVAEVEGLNREFAVEVCHYNVPVLRVLALVDNEDVAVVDVGILHALAHDTAVEGGFGIVDEFLVEVYALLYIVLCRGGKAAPYAFIGIGQGQDAPHVGTVEYDGVFGFFLHGDAKLHIYFDFLQINNFGLFIYVSFANFVPLCLPWWIVITAM